MAGRVISRILGYLLEEEAPDEKGPHVFTGRNRSMINFADLSGTPSRACPTYLYRRAKNLDDGQGHSMAAALPPLGCERLTPGWTRIFPPSVVVAMIPSL